MADASEHIQALADLFLTGNRPPSDAPATIAERARAVRPTIEMIVVGHRPVRAGLWLTQYADDVAREEGPTALIRFDAEQTVLEILRGSETAARASAAATLEEAVARAGPEIRRWIIRPSLEADMTGMLDAAPDVITILSGADDAATVAAYRTVKELFDAASRVDARLPTIELVILGADPAAAKRAADSIADTAELHLGVTVNFRRCVRAMGALGSTLHFRFAAEQTMPLASLTRMLADVHDAEAEAVDLHPPHMMEPVAAMELDVPLSTLQPDDAAPVGSRVRSIATPINAMGFAIPSVASSFVQAGMDEPVHAPHAEPIPSPAMRLRPKIAVHVEPKHVAPHPPPRSSPPARALTTWIEGLALLPVRCPDAPEIEIAVDAQGALHLIAWDDRLRAISQVKAWLIKHRQLVAMACHEHSINGEEIIASHIVTSEPKQVADLYGADYRLHLLAPVEVEGKTGWFSAALNG